MTVTTDPGFPSTSKTGTLYDDFISSSNCHFTFKGIGALYIFKLLTEFLTFSIELEVY